MKSLENIKNDFPIFSGNDIVYFDNAATTQKPVSVLDAVEKYYSTCNANPLRGLYGWSIDATEGYEKARKKVADFIGAKDSREIVFTRNATESLNLIAYSYGLANIKKGQKILVSITEHHSNILPWQMVAKKTGASLEYLECRKDGSWDLQEIEKKITNDTALVAMGQVSNVLGVKNPIKKVIELTHQVGGVVVVDGAQSVPHMQVDLKELDADFFVFSGHKLLAPMGIGVMYGKKKYLEEMPPFLTGGEMIEYVTRYDATYAELPHKFEAGTVNAGAAIGLGAAIDYIKEIGFDEISKKEEELTEFIMKEMKKLPYITIYGSEDPKNHCGIVTFNIDGCHPHDVSSILDTYNVCVRAGHHCAQPLMQYLDVNATCRASMYFYNTMDEAERFIEALTKVRTDLGF